MKTIYIVLIVLAVLLIVPALLIMFGGLAYFGALSPTRMLPDSCTTQAGFSCPAFALEGNVIRLQLMNVMGEPLVLDDEFITITNMEGCNVESVSTSLDGMSEWSLSEPMIISITCNEQEMQKTIVGNMILTAQVQSSPIPMSHTIRIRVSDQ
ncbi:MAG: hypothetical protein ACMXYE_03690 [Candidatus Woesearchaeota archaeon]